VPMTSVLALAVVLVVVIAAAFMAYAGVLRALGYPGAQQLWSMPGRIVGRLRRRRGAAP
jgi:putative peptidoglycan lipid II flippase